VKESIYTLAAVLDDVSSELGKKLAKFLARIRPKPPVVPPEAERALLSFIQGFSEKTGLEAPRLVIEPKRDQPSRIAFYSRARRSIYPNCRKLAKTWGKGDSSTTFWKGIMGHEFGHHVQSLEGRRFSWKRRLFVALRHPYYGTGSPAVEMDAWETGERISGVSRKGAYSAYDRIRPRLWNTVMKLWGPR
jgi:hypothetical protein